MGASACGDFQLVRADNQLGALAIVLGAGQTFIYYLLLPPAAGEAPGQQGRGQEQGNFSFHRVPFPFLGILGDPLPFIIAFLPEKNKPLRRKAWAA